MPPSRIRILSLCAGGVFLAAASATPSRASPVTDATDAYQRGDYTTAFAGLKPLADQGYNAACVIVGRMYLDGNGVAKDAAMAAKYFTLASDRGTASASSFLADLYATGEGVPIDPAEAIRLWRRAGHLGDPFAAHKLGLELERGIDVPEDKLLALRWLDSSIEHLGSTNPSLRAQFLSDRDELAATLTAADIAAAAALVTPEGPTERVALRDEPALAERAKSLYPRELRREGGQGSVVVLLLVAANGHVTDARLECSSGVASFDEATLALMRGALAEPTRMNGVPVSAWQVAKWTWAPKT